MSNNDSNNDKVLDIEVIKSTPIELPKTRIFYLGVWEDNHGRVFTTNIPHENKQYTINSLIISTKGGWIKRYIIELEFPII